MAGDDVSARCDGGRRARPPAGHVNGARHLYVHLPFCVHRCGYCDFVTVVGRPDDHAPYVHALLAELEREREVLAEPLDSVFVGGGTPTFTRARGARRAPPSAARCHGGDRRGQSRDGDARSWRHCCVNAA